VLIVLLQSGYPDGGRVRGRGCCYALLPRSQRRRSPITKSRFPSSSPEHQRFRFDPVSASPYGNRRFKNGLWLSLVERLPRVQEAAGSNPASPITAQKWTAASAVAWR